MSLWWDSPVSAMFEGDTHVCKILYALIFVYVIAVYSPTLPFRRFWDESTLYNGVFLFASKLAEYVEMRLYSSTIDERETSVLGEASLLSQNSRVVNLLSNRYIEDIALDDTSIRYEMFGPCICNQSNANYLKDKLPDVTIDQFNRKVEEFGEALLRISNGLAPSHYDASHVDAAVVSKTADYIEDLLYSHQVQNNFMAMISEWLHCRHVMYVQCGSLV
jgi:hypothetical protein